MDQHTLLRSLCQTKGNVALSNFLEFSSSALKCEVEKLAKPRKDAIPYFQNIHELNEVYHNSTLALPEVESSLAVIAQLAHFFAYVVALNYKNKVFANSASYCSRDLTKYPGSSKSRALGLCTGLIAAASVASAKSLSELLPLAVEAAKIAFRIGVCVANVGSNIDNVSSSWSTLITGVSEQNVRQSIDDFHQSTQVAPFDQIYISAVSPVTLTISGPPKVARRLFEEGHIFRDAQMIKLPIYAPYHANHLYSTKDVETILNFETSNTLQGFRPQMHCNSAVTGQCFTATNTLALFEQVLHEILREPVHLDVLLRETASQMISLKVSDCSVATFGISNFSNTLVSSLTASGQCNVVLEDSQSYSASSRPPTLTARNNKVAIVGMSGRFPGAASHDALWELLEKGLDVHREVPSDRFDANAHCEPSGKGKNKSHTPFGCFIEEPGVFDARFFNMSPREAAQTDPMGRLALVTAYEALEMSGFVPGRTPSTKAHRVGTFYGQTSDDWREINAAENIDTYFITGGVRAFAPGRINYYFKFSGPSYSIDTACSSSLAAIQLACTSLWAGDCDTACAGGLNVLTNPDIFAGLSKGQFLSKTGSCKTYDNDADGYCRGDGCGTIILKRYEDAIADNDHILGCILAAATNHSAEAVSITHPHAGAQESLYNKVLLDAGVDAHDISYVEMHGTGTQAGDGIEMTSVSNVFAPRNRQRTEDQPLYLGAIKANIGHGEAASGINSLVKILLMMKNSAIPANVGIKGVMNQNFPKDLYKRNVHIETKQISYPRKGSNTRKIFLNNFSAAGGNTAILLEDGPLKIESKAVDPRRSHLVVISARSIAALKQNIYNLIDYLTRHRDVTLSSLAYTTTARRLHHNYRVALVASESFEIIDLLRSQIKESYNPIGLIPAKVAFVFTGQGSQYAGIARQLYEDLTFFRSNIEYLNLIVQKQGFPSILPLLNDEEILSLPPVVIQLGIACIEISLHRMWESWGVKPAVVLGHSLGEYAALHVAGIISVSDMVFLVGRRAQLLERYCTPSSHGMLAVKGSINSIMEALSQKMVQVACINATEEIVLSGTAEEIEEASNVLSQKGLKSTKLKVPFAFHSAQIDPIMDEFKVMADSITYKKPTIPLLSPLLGSVIRDEGIICGEYLMRHAREPVDFCAAINTGLIEETFDSKTVWVELGPQPFCLSMIRSCLSDNSIGVPSLRRTEEPWRTLALSLSKIYLSGVPIDFNEYHRNFESANELLQLPAYAFDNKRYWLDYHNNWCLTKGEASDVSSDYVKRTDENTFCTTSCQKVVSESLQENFGSVLFRSNLAEPKLHAAVCGHLVNDNPLCPSSLYADMAMTSANYLYKKLFPNSSEIGFNICKMEVTKPLIAKIPAPPEGQYLDVNVTANKEDKCAFLKFSSVTRDGKVIQEHANCTVTFEEIKIWKEEWSRVQYMVQSQIEHLRYKLEKGRAHKILRGMAYKLFKALVSYEKRYQGMEEIILDAKQTEAVSKVRFQADGTDGNFFCSPYWIDSLAHISGFTVNASDILDSEKSVYISHGWSSIKISCTLSAEKEYHCYVRMIPCEANISVGDVYILEGDKIVGVVNGLKFQNIPRRALNIMLPSPGNPKLGGISAESGNIEQRHTDSSASAKSVSRTFQPSTSSTSAKLKPKGIHKPIKNVRDSSVTVKALKIISAETNVDISELVDDAAFENLGVDSLMSLALSAKFREELDIEINSTLFTDYPTIGRMKMFISQYDNSTISAESESSDESSFESTSSPTPVLQDGYGTPLSSSPSSVSSLLAKEEVVERASQEPSAVREVIAKEMGVSASDILDDADLSELGMDSLMSLAILSALREKTNIDLPSSFLNSNSTIRDIEIALDVRPRPQQKALVTPVTYGKETPSSTHLFNSELHKPICDISQYPPATSLLLQGNSKTSNIKLFLLPDGSGSATSYAGIPKISPNVAAYGLNCPFMKSPSDFTCGIEVVSAIYLAEIKRRQPKGPYFIGGWSAGGVIAYEVAAQLVTAGERVQKLVLIDAPCPVKLEPLPARLHYFFDSIGLLGTGRPGTTPDWLLPHFGSSIKALSDYEPKKIPVDRAPLTFAIWATDGVCGNEGDPKPPSTEGGDPKPMTWLLDNRTDFGDNGWAQLLGQENMDFAVMGGNHFTMMKGELVS